MGGIGIPQNPQAAMTRRPKPEDAASHITVRSCVCVLAHSFIHSFIRIKSNGVCCELGDGLTCFTWFGRKSPQYSQQQ